MNGLESINCTAFVGDVCVAAGPVPEVAVQVKRLLDRGAGETLLIFDDATGDNVEIDFRGTEQDVASRLRPDTAGASGGADEIDTRRGPGRPKLGVVAREITLLPRHWSWLNEQPGGASVALRKLVEEARKANEVPDRQRRARDSAYKFISTIAGNRINFEEATRALFAGNSERFLELISSWPKDVRLHAQRLAAGDLQPSL